MRTDQVDKRDEACVKANVHIWTVGKDYVIRSCDQERNRNVGKSHMIGHDKVQ